MPSETGINLINLAFGLLISGLVWRHYRDLTVSSDLRYSTFSPRICTGFIDSCVLWPVTFLTTALLAIDLPKSVAAVLMVVDTLAWLLYTVMLHARYGQTVGKMVTKVRVVDFRTEQQISYRQAWLREGIPLVLGIGALGYEVFAIFTGQLTPKAFLNGQALVAGSTYWFLVMLPGLWFLAEVLTMLTNKKRRALHDFIAGTVVVRTNTRPEVIQQGIPAASMS